MANCSFCGKNIAPGLGVTLFKRDGTALHYCSRKCERNLEMGRNPRKFKWTTKFATTAKKKHEPKTPKPEAQKEPKKKRLSTKARKIEAKKAEEARKVAEAAAETPKEETMAADEAKAGDSSETKQGTAVDSAQA